MVQGKARFIFLGVWILSTFAVLAIFFRYENTPSKQVTIGKAWPLNSSLRFVEDKNNLIAFLHPKCSCSRATIAELEKILLKLQKNLAVQLIFALPLNHKEWVEADLVKEASKLKNVIINFDETGAMAESFRAFSSGQIYFYDKQKSLIYQGGITPSRGHQGLSYGKVAILDYLTLGKLPDHAGAVFGCALADSR